MNKPKTGIFSKFKAKINIKNKKIPSQRYFIRPGIHKPLYIPSSTSGLTSFQTSKTGSKPRSYVGKTGGRLFKWVAVILISLISSYAPGLFVKNSIGGKLASVSVAQASGNDQIEVWWPVNQAVVNGTQPFKAIDKNKSLDQYKMYWQVDNGQLNEMLNSQTDYPHKESLVDLSGWNWKGNGPYTLNFVAFDLSGQQLAAKSEVIYLGQAPAAPASAATVQPAAAPAASAAPASCPKPAANSFTGCYFSDQNFSNLKLSRIDSTLNFDWGGGSPDPSIPTDHYSVRWQGNYKFTSGNYDFVVTADDGVRVYVDNSLIIDQFKDQAATTYRATKNLSAGNHLIKIEYYENTGAATAKFSWNKVVDAQNPSAPIKAALTSYKPAGNIFAGAKFYVDPNSNAKRQADAWRSSRPKDAAMMDKIAAQSNATWLGGWNGDIKSDVNKLVSAAAAQNALPTLIVYNIPNRDCGGYSAGGTQTADAYKQWIRNLAAGIGSRKAAIILEPDSVALTSCLSSADLQTRYSLLQDAVSVFKSLGHTAVYIDAGHANWLSADETASKLKSAGVAMADGFALNVSNFTTTSDNVSFGKSVSGKLGGKHFIIDTSRNGNGPTPDNQWCNPAGRALGSKPTASTNSPLIDAFVWGKQPGESDGACNGGPSAGVWWPEYALGLAQGASW